MSPAWAHPIVTRVTITLRNKLGCSWKLIITTIIIVSSLTRML